METERSSNGLEAVLAALEAKRDEIEQAIKVVRGLAAQPPSDAPVAIQKNLSVHTLTPTSFFAMGVAEAAKKYLAVVKEPKTVPEIAKALQAHGIKTVSKNFTATVFSALDRCATSGEMVRPKRGQWGLAEWYPGLRRRDNGDKKESQPPAKSSLSKSSDDARIAKNSGNITVDQFEQFVREKPRRVKAVQDQFGVNREAVIKLLEPNSKVHLAGIGWLKIRE